MEKIVAIGGGELKDLETLVIDKEIVSLTPHRLVQGLGLIKGIHCPHYHEEKREKEFEQGIETYGNIGIALDNNTALEIVDGQFRILASREDPKAYRVIKRNGRVVTEPIQMKSAFQPLSELFS